MTDYGYQNLQRELDRVKAKVFLGTNAAFLGPLMCSVNFAWMLTIKTAATNGIYLYWNPHFFMAIPPETRVTVLLHELWHIALMHMLRRGGRNAKVWNWACDIWINDMLCRAGYTFDGTYPWISDNLNRWKHPTWEPIGSYDESMSVEQIYDALMKQMQSNPDFGPTQPVWGITGENGQGDEGDIIEPEDKNSGVEHAVVNKVVSSVTAAKLAGHPGNLPGDLESVLDKFLNPKLPWDTLFRNFFNELYEEDYTLARPDRRFQDIYLPSLEPIEGGLEHIMWFQDVSGSVTDNEILRLMSEFKYVRDTYKPRLVTLVQFDTEIQDVTVYEQDDLFEELHVIGRGGTSLVCVRDYIIKHQPTCVVVFSDLDCRPMEPYPTGMDIPTIWVGVNADSNQHVHFGKLIHIKE